jgi:TonB family protein
MMGSARDMATVSIPSSTNVPAVTAALPGNSSGRTPAITVKATPPPPTVKSPFQDDIVTAKVPGATTKAARPASPAPSRPPVPASLPPAPVAKPLPSLPPQRPGVSPVAVLAGAAAFFVVALGLAAVMLWQRGEPEAAPAPIVVAEPTPAPATPAPVFAGGALRIETTPPGAAISVNGEPRGSAPLDLAGLAIGSYEVRAELKGYDAKAEVVAIVESEPNATVSLTLSRTAPTTGSVEVVSEPAGATVTVDGGRGGETPIAELKLRPGSHALEIVADGYERWTGSVNVEAGKKARVEAVLREVPKATPTPPPAVDAGRVYFNTTADVEVLAKKVTGGTASYPSNAPRLKSGDSVSVSLTFVVDENGDVEEPKVVESAGSVIDDAVVKAVRKWKYSPALKQGVKVKVKIAFKQTFRAG